MKRHRCLQRLPLLFIVPLLLTTLWPVASAAQSPLVPDRETIQEKHDGKSGVRILEKGEESLLARLWMIEAARKEICAMTFIWRFDGTGYMFLDALLRAAERGIKVKILLDDYTLAEKGLDPLMAMDFHANCDVRIYNPKITVDVSYLEAAANLIMSFEKVNQRMHNKTFVIDGGRCALTGGRNIGNEYFDNCRKFCFHDRDAFVLGKVAEDMQNNFDHYWNDNLSRPLVELLEEETPEMTREKWNRYADKVHARGRVALLSLPHSYRPEELDPAMEQLLQELRWVQARFVSDPPEKYGTSLELSENQGTAGVLRWFINQAKERITIQSPYFVLQKDPLSLFDERRENVAVYVSTNSLANTDNILAFSGYTKRRDVLIKAGFILRELKPRPPIFLHRWTEGPWALHAKNVVIDGRKLFIGTFNIDPRSTNLNTEEGIIVDDAVIAAEVEKRIHEEMDPANSWDPVSDDPDDHAEWSRWFKLQVYQMLPLSPYL